MHYCDSCGRKVENSCSCLYKKKISKFETYLVFIYLMAAPAALITYQYNQYQSLNFPFMAFGAMSLALLLMVLSLLNAIFRKSYLALFFGCHQMTSRSFKLRDYVFPICARCTGIYMGILLSVILGYYTKLYYFYPIFMIPLIVDGIIQKKTNYRSNQFKRFLTGILFGPGFSLIFSLYHYLILYLALWLRTL